MMSATEHSSAMARSFKSSTIFGFDMNAVNAEYTRAIWFPFELRLSGQGLPSGLIGSVGALKEITAPRTRFVQD
jgi:hypothetical protein